MRILTAFVAAALAAATLHAESATTTIQVSACVIGRTIVTVQSTPSVVLTDADLARGWIEVAEPSLISVRSNQRAGFRLAFAPTAAWIARAEGTGLSEATSFGAAGGSVAFAYAGTAPRELQIRWKLYLSPEATAGTFPLPIEIGTLN